MSKRVVFGALVAVFAIFLVAGGVRADQIAVTGAFTSFTGDIIGQSSTFFEFCPANSCGVVGPPPPPVATCPDAGCATVVGTAHVPIGGDPTRDTINQLSFRIEGSTENALIFNAAAPANLSPTSEFKLGTLTFTNGIWSGDADFGFSIVARDSTTATSHRFDGLIHMSLTPNTGTTPQQNADFIYITNLAGQPAVNPLTLQPLGSIRAYELADSPSGSNSVTVDLFGKFRSLDLTRFDNPTEGGFLDVSVTSDLGGPPGAVAEPGTFGLLGSGVLALAALKKLKV